MSEWKKPVGKSFVLYGSNYTIFWKRQVVAFSGGKTGR